jgi:NAD(P)H-flavin reductase
MDTFAYTCGMFEHVIMISAGTGLTPMYQIFDAICSNDKDNTKITAICCNRSEHDMLLRHKLAIWQKNNPDTIRVTHVLSRPRRDPEKLKKVLPGLYTSRLTLSSLAEILGAETKNNSNESSSEKPVIPWIEGTEVLICGPDGFCTDVSNMLTVNLGWPASIVHTLGG